MTTPDLKRRAIHGMTASLAGSLASGLFQIVVMVIMARLVSPRDYGVLAMAQLFLRLASYFSGFGIIAALVRKAELQEEHIRAAWGSALAIGAMCCAAMWLAAPLARLLFPTPQVVSVVRLLALNLLLGGMAVVSSGLLIRAMRFGTLALINLLTYIVAYGAVGIPLACRGAGVVALIAALLVQSALQVVLQYCCTRHDLRPATCWHTYREILGFGGLHSLAGFSEFLGNAVDTFAVGRWLGDQAIGLYNRAAQLVNLPIQLLAGPAMRIFLPLFSQVQADPELLRRVYCSTLSAVALVSLPLGVGIVPMARDLLEVVLGPRWMAGAPALVAYALIAPLGLMAAVAFDIHDIRGTMRVKALIQLFTLAGFVILVTTGLHWGMAGVAYTAVGGYLLRLLLELRLVHGLLGVTRRHVLAALAPALWSAGVLLAIGLAGSWALAWASALFRLLWLFLAGPPVVVSLLLTLRLPGTCQLTAQLRDVCPQAYSWPFLGLLLKRLGSVPVHRGGLSGGDR